MDGRRDHLLQPERGAQDTPSWSPCSSPNRQLHLRNKIRSRKPAGDFPRRIVRLVRVGICPQMPETRMFKNQRSLCGLDAVLDGPSLSFCQGEGQ